MKPFNRQKVVIDKITYTIKLYAGNSYNSDEVSNNLKHLKSLMSNEFGKYKPLRIPTEDKKTKEQRTISGVKFDNGLWISDSLTLGWCRLTFCADQVDLLKLKKVLSMFDSTYKNKDDTEVKAQNIRDLEIAFDLDVGNCSREKLIDVTKLISKYIRPINIQNSTYNCIEGESKVCKDGSENGEITLYFNSKARKSKKVDSNYYTKRSMTVKIYIKSMDNVDNDGGDLTYESDTQNGKKTFIRVEAKLNSRYIDKLFMKPLKESEKVEMFELDRIVPYIKENSKFTKFFEFIELNRKRFFIYAERHVDLTSKKIINIKEKIEKCDSNARRLALMKAIGKLAKTRTLSNNIKKYVRNVKCEKIRRKIDEIVNS